jgi:hypothetical protein
MACHATQFSDEVLRRVFPLQAQVWNGAIALAPAFSTAPGADVFR